MGNKASTPSQNDPLKNGPNADKKNETPNQNPHNPHNQHNPHINPHTFLSQSYNEIPSECPMHKSKAEQSPPAQAPSASGGCPIKPENKESDINPNNMVVI